jgi:outer membrane receptor protein involved in Fe transport
MRMRHLFSAFLVLMFFTAFVWAQNYGTVSGAIKDPSGATVPNASLKITNLATGVTVTAVTLSDGKYLLSNLAPGTYEISTEVPGFKRYVSSGIEIHVSDRLVLDIALQLGQVQETVTVTGETQLLRTTDAQTGDIITSAFVSNLPQLNRDAFALINLAGNVQGEGNNVELNGGRTSAVDYYIDGGVANSGASNLRTNTAPSMDAVAEFKVVTSGISAEFGRISGGYVTMVTKSGSNALHGSAYEYMFDDAFNANSWAQNVIGAKKAQFRQHDFGYTVGGPVVLPKIYNGKNRTFFFVDNEFYRRNSAGSMVLNSVPTDLERTGDFSQTLYMGKNPLMYDPDGPQVFNTSNGLWERTGLLGGDGHHVPAARISSVSKAILKMVPAANRAPTANNSSLNNYQFPSGSKSDSLRFGVRLDHSVTNSQQMNFRFTRYSSTTASTPTMESPLYVSNQSKVDGGLNGSLNYAWTAGPSVVVELRASAVYSPNFTGNTHEDGFDNSFLPSIYKEYLGTEIPNIDCTFMSGTAIAQRGTQSTTNSTSYNYGGSVTKVISNHTLKFGGESRRYYDNFTNAGTSNQMNFMVNQLYRFQGDWGLGHVDGRVLAMGSFLMGINSRNNIAKPTDRQMNTNYYGFFVQDDWKITPKLTLNLGLRYDNERPTTERHDRLFFWDPDYPSLFTINSGYNFAAELAKAGLPADSPVPTWVTNGKFDPGAVLIANTPEFPSRTPQHPANLLFAPRLGIAYQLDQKTVVRISGGKMFLPTTGNAGSYATSNSNVALSDQAYAGWHASTDGGRHYISTWDTPFALPSMFTKATRDTKTVNLQSSLDPGATAFSRTLRMPREYNWSFSIQRELPLKTVVEVGYSGNRGLGLIATDTISHYPAELLVPKYASVMQQFMLSPNAGQTLETTITGTKQQLGLLQYQYPYYGRVQVSALNEGRSIYHALNLRVERRLQKGLSLLMNYTMSRLFDDVGGADGTGGKTVQSIDSFHKAWGLSPLDRTHKLNVVSTLEFPVGKSKKWLGSPSGIGQAVLDKVVGGWQVAGNFRRTSGTPLILTGSTNSNINNTIKVNQTWGSYATDDHNLTPSTFTDYTQLLTSTITPVTSSSVRFLDPAKVKTAQAFISGNLPPTDPAYRNPAFYQADISLMKNFYFMETRYAQFRLEMQNAFNIRGLGNVQSQIGNTYYGLITSAGNSPRQMQLSLRVNF